MTPAQRVTGSPRRSKAPRPLSAIAKRGWWTELKRRVDVAGQVPVDLADESKGQVQLIVVLPAGAGHPAHQAEQPGADRRRRADRDEQTVHARLLSGRRTACVPVFLECRLVSHDIGGHAASHFAAKGESSKWLTDLTRARPQRRIRLTAAGREGVAFDAGLRSYMLSVYNYMASGVLLTGIVACCARAATGIAAADLLRAAASSNMSSCSRR